MNIQKIRHADEIIGLDQSEVDSGYRDGLAGDIRDPSAVSKSYFQGWRVGMMEAGRMEIDDAMLALRASLAATVNAGRK